MRVFVLWLVCLPVFASGTLHDASVGEWRRANLLNKIETAADWVEAVNTKTHMLGRSPSGEVILRFAGGVVDCVDEVVVDAPAADRVIPIAAICINLLK